MTSQTLHGCLQGFPGAALELAPDGIVRASNGTLDALVGRELAGEPFESVLDSTSRAKWRRILSGDPDDANPACTWELVVTTPTTLELRTFLAVRAADQDGGSIWMLEHTVDPKLETLYAELTDLHRDLVEAQRELGRERARLAGALEKAEAAIATRDDVLAIVSHDLRNPLNTIQMAAGVLELPIAESRRAEQVAVVLRAADTMNRLIGDLLDVSAIESGQLRLDREPVTLNTLLEDCREMMAESAAQRKQQIEFSADSIPPILADRGRILQVLTNLVGNAIKFTPEGGRVDVQARRRDDDEVAISVEDTGPGIPESELSRVFDRFWHTTRRRHGGAGLGLAIAQGIVEAHGGRIWAESPPGRGARFCFTLPGGAEA